MVEEIGLENVLHVVTDNGSNYKKACKELLSEVYEHIAWTPCLAHTVNLILKDIARRPEHGVMIKQLLSVKTHRRVATGNTKSREAAGALAGTGPSVNGPDPGTRRRFRRCRVCHLTYT